MRSEVVKVKRVLSGQVSPVGHSGSCSQVLSDLLPELQMGETKSVRISAEIVEEKGGEKVGSKAILEKSDVTGMALLCLDYSLLKKTIEGFQPGESRKVKSILFDTPSGVPVVEFVEEAPREMLKRAMDEAVKEHSFHDGYAHLKEAIINYLAATEGEG